MEDFVKRFFLRFLLLFFTITLIPTLAQQNKSIKLISPIGGEYYRVSDVEKIEWTSTNVNSIAIDYSIDDGKTWSNIANYLDPAVGNYYWSVPDPTANKCRIKVRDRSDPSVRDYSANSFLITMKPEINVYFVSSKIIWELNAGEKIEISWFAKNTSGINLEYTTDEGYSWTPIVSNLSTSCGGYEWQIPNTPSSQCYIAAYDSKNPLIRNQSDYAFTIIANPTAVEEHFIPQFRLEQNYPNPFNPTTTITYSIPEKSHVQLIVYDVLGTEVSTLVNEEKAAGNYEVKFSADELSSGIYFYKLQTGQFTDIKKMLITK